MKRSLLILMSCVLLLAGCGKHAVDESAWQEQYDLGVRYLAEGKYEEAIIAFTAAIEIDPKKAEAYINLSDAWIMNGEPQEALAVLRKGIDVTGASELEELLLDLEAWLTEENEVGVDRVSEETGQSTQVPEVTEEQRAALNELCRLLEAREYIAAADYAISAAEFIMPLIDGEVYLYYDETLHAEIDGSGLVVETAWKDSVGVHWTCYYGNFENGMPEGKCRKFTAGDSYITNERDYYVVEGSWIEGTLNGKVKTDRYAYKNSSDKLYRKMVEGDFENGLAEGQIMITQYYSTGSEMNYIFTASAGYPVADDTWDTSRDGTPRLRCQEYYPGILGEYGAALTEDFYVDVLWNSGFWE